MPKEALISKIQLKISCPDKETCTNGKHDTDYRPGHICVFLLKTISGLGSPLLWPGLMSSLWVHSSFLLKPHHWRETRMFFCANESDYTTFPLKTPQRLSILLGKRQNPFVCVRLSVSAGSPGSLCRRPSSSAVPSHHGASLCCLPAPHVQLIFNQVRSSSPCRFQPQNLLREPLPDFSEWLRSPSLHSHSKRWRCSQHPSVSRCPCICVMLWSQSPPSLDWKLHTARNPMLFDSPR